MSGAAAGGPPIRRKWSATASLITWDVIQISGQKAVPLAAFSFFNLRSGQPTLPFYLFVVTLTSICDQWPTNFAYGFIKLKGQMSRKYCYPFGKKHRNGWKTISHDRWGFMVLSWKGENNNNNNNIYIFPFLSFSRVYFKRSNFRGNHAFHLKTNFRLHVIKLDMLSFFWSHGDFCVLDMTKIVLFNVFTIYVYIALGLYQKKKREILVKCDKY